MSNVPSDRRSMLFSPSFFWDGGDLLHSRQAYGRSGVYHLDYFLDAPPCMRRPVHHHCHRARLTVNGHLQHPRGAYYYRLIVKKREEGCERGACDGSESTMQQRHGIVEPNQPRQNDSRFFLGRESDRVVLAESVAGNPTLRHNAS
jgi:hypothetical protein